MLAGSHWGGVRRLTPIKKEVNMNDNNCISDVFHGSLLVEEARPEKGFFIKSKERCFSLRDNKWHSKFSWEPVVVSDLDLIEKVLHGNKSGLCIRKWPADKMLHLKLTTKLYNTLASDSKKCGQSMSRHCTELMRGKHPRAAFSEEELELLRNLKKERSDVQLMFNAMIAELAGLPDAERMRVVINDKSYDWWREHLITALEFFDQMRDRVISNAD